ncbi:hypothetical protein D6C86_07853 [Aureobasidium pullulans]|uniref:Uncharacterized protein n=1 Tax=Aureobasidium pullulans TaxID=5580 RepID=A0A4S9UTB6_AURPU|nr:hypothetical protein D6C94_05885 [Aureobasidium pullulans]THZ42160.1 hypothetical protein D6C87_05203 [Aureobasidium pullulans]THZ56426.1 hypothetical protein D6C86_07853 [Aureobasidium pullulans]
MAGRNLPSVSAQQQILGDLVPQGTAGHEQGAYNHDFDNVPMGCMRQVCSAGHAARARRNKKSEREQREEDIVADFRHEKERLVAEVRLKELIVQQKELSIQELDVRIRTMDLEHSIQNRTMEREHQAELVSRDHSEAILLGDLREFCQFNDEEVEELRRTIDREALPPAYDQIDTHVNGNSVTDIATANATTILSSAKASLRRAIAESHDRPDRLLRIAQGFLHAIASITRANKKAMWPLECTSQILDAIYEMCSRVSQYITLSYDNEDDEPPQRLPHRILSCLNTTHRAHRTLRKAFLSADSLSTDIISHHFSSGGRRAGLYTAAIPFHSPLRGNTDLEDEFLDLQFWKIRLEGVKRGILEWRDDVGVVVFGECLEWLELGIMGSV